MHDINQTIFLLRTCSERRVGCVERIRKWSERIVTVDGAGYIDAVAPFILDIVYESKREQCYRKGIRLRKILMT